MNSNETLLIATENAYSKDRFSQQGWIDCIDYLLRAGLSEQEVKAFLLSKHMRWAGDCDESDLEYGDLNLSTLQNYLKQYPEYGTSVYIQNNIIE